MSLLNKNLILKKGQKVAKTATIATIILSLIKGVVGFLSGSIILMADAVHSAVDTVAIFSSWFGLKISQKEYSEKFPYGYYKIENFATLIVSLFIFFASYKIFTESYGKLFVESQLSIPVLALIVPLLSALASYFIAVYEDRVGKEINSQSLIANAQESKVDVASSLAVFVGILLAYFNINYIESVLGMGLSLVILKIGYQNAKIAFYSLTDASLDKVLEKNIKDTIVGIKEVKEVTNLKLRQAGLFVFGETKIKLAKNLSVDRANDIVNKIEKEIKNKYKKVEFLTIRIEPYQTETIKIIIPVNDDKGLDSKIIEHFGRAEYFLFVTIKNKKIVSLYTKKNYFINEKIRAGLSVTREILKEKINVALTKEIGEISFHALRDNLIDIYFIQEGNAKKAINNFINGRLKKLDEPTHLSDK